MSKNPIVITTLDEDMKALGLQIHEEDEKKDKDEPELSADAKKKAAEKPGKEREAIPAEPKKEDAAPDAAPVIDEGKRIKKKMVRKGSSYKRMTIKHHLSSAERASKRTKSHTGAGKVAINKHERKVKQQKSKYAKRANALQRAKARYGEGVEVQNLRTVVECFRRVAGTSKVEESVRVENASNRVAQLLEEVQSILNASKTPKIDMAEATKTFAHVAIISEMLSGVFQTVSDTDGMDGQLAEDELADAKRLAEAAENFAELAESAADHATRMKAGQLSEDEQKSLTEDFRNMMTSLLQGLDVYAEIEEACEEDDDEDEPDDEDDKDEKPEGGKPEGKDKGEAEKGSK
jgi:hypothetical protein